MTDHEQLANDEARHGNLEALERLTKELEECRRRLQKQDTQHSDNQVKAWDPCPNCHRVLAMTPIVGGLACRWCGARVP